ncbi:MAG: polysaccharide deacetylase family protein, partial [Clostridiales bacterium]|nr:polysaccharide deacetylase family protein [Clostridiales bacterium]
MTGKVRFFKYVVANLAIGFIVIGILAFTLTGNAVKNVSADAPVYKGESKTKISLMVNVYWGTEYLDEMLDIFAKNEVTTTFFVGGMWAAENDGMLKKIHAAGHEIGNHGYFHKDHKKLNAQRNAEEISVTHRLVKSI